MIFIINSKKYDTGKMEKIADVEKWYKVEDARYVAVFGKNVKRNYDCELWKSYKGNWLITHEGDYLNQIGEAIEEAEAKELLLKYDVKKYEELFGEIEEA